MAADESPYVFHRPSGAVVVMSVRPDEIRIRNAEQGLASYAVVIAGPSFGSTLKGIGSLMEVGRQLIERVRRS